MAKLIAAAHIDVIRARHAGWAVLSALQANSFEDGGNAIDRALTIKRHEHRSARRRDKMIWALMDHKFGPKSEMEDGETNPTPSGAAQIGEANPTASPGHSQLAETNPTPRLSEFAETRQTAKPSPVCRNEPDANPSPPVCRNEPEAKERMEGRAKVDAEAGRGER